MTNPTDKQTNRGPLPLLILSALCLGGLVAIGLASGDYDLVYKAVIVFGILAAALLGLQAFAAQAKKHGTRFRLTETWPCGAVEHTTGYRFWGMEHFVPDEPGNKPGCPTHGERCQPPHAQNKGTPPSTRQAQGLHN